MKRGWLSLPDEQKIEALQQAKNISSIGMKAIEKDWWVTIVLKALFEGPYGKFMIFKGGTSLSKCWNLIERFSEDVDIAIDSMIIGVKYMENPTKGQIERLRRKGCAFTSGPLKDSLEKELQSQGVPSGMLKIAAAEVDKNFPDKDPQILLIRYPSLFDSDPYIKDEVRLEFSIRSLIEPNTEVQIHSLLFTWFPNPITAESPITLLAVDPKKTFLEKAFLLHENFQKPDLQKVRVRRMSRHFYDLHCLNIAGIADAALADENLYASIIKHRKNYNRLKHVQYDTLARTAISFLPPRELLEQFESDYLLMQEQMIYGDALPFESLLEALNALSHKFTLN